MKPAVWEIAAYAFIPAVFTIVGGLLGYTYTIKEKFQSIIQHLVAGIVFGAVAVDLLPKILNTNSALTVGSGFAAGVVVMLLMMAFTHRLEHVGSSSKLPVGLLLAVVLDVFIDGILIGVSFLAGKESGILITIALATCVFFLGLSTAIILKDRNMLKSIALLWLGAIAIMMPLGAWVGGAVISVLPSTWLTETLAFGVAALLYLGAEELLVEAHKTDDSPWLTLPFFVGFLAILLLKL